ncbi:hypothetical protein, partial [Neisseria sp. P0024.S006]|uniref:hypothetical protein n=1 Tax=Neisseria sp. P0024.S006 TaxID=3436850 RepID=UPI003F807070
GLFGDVVVGLVWFCLLFVGGVGLGVLVVVLVGCFGLCVVGCCLWVLWWLVGVWGCGWCLSVVLGVGLGVFFGGVGGVFGVFVLGGLVVVGLFFFGWWVVGWGGGVVWVGVGGVGLGFGGVLVVVFGGVGVGCFVCGNVWVGFVGWGWCCWLGGGGGCCCWVCCWC